MLVNRQNTLHVNVIQGIFLLQLMHQLCVFLQDIYSLHALHVFHSVRVSTHLSCYYMCNVNLTYSYCHVYGVTIDGVWLGNRISSSFFFFSFISP
jgi:hypothetical protein